MAKSDIIRLTNMQEDTKELGVVNGKRFVIGSKLDAGLVAPNIAPPTLEISRADYDELLGSPAVEQTLKHWFDNHQVIARGL